MSGAVQHFGELVRAGKYGHRLTRELYAAPSKRNSTLLPREMYSDELWASSAWMYEDDEHTRYTDEFCATYQAAARENFDLNLAFFAQLPAEPFETALEEILLERKQLRPVVDLRTLHGVEGLYIMVLDNYRQAYVGQSNDMRARIKKHWAGTKQFDRLLWGDKHTSVLSIESFRALDTTRIFAARTSSADALERKVVRDFPPDFLLNRIGGGDMSGIRALFIAAEVKRRRLAAGSLPDASPEFKIHGRLRLD